MPVVIVRCDGGAAIGLGHVSRCLALADALRDRRGCRLVFAMRDQASAGAAAVRRAGYTIAPVNAPENADYGDELVALTESLDASAVVVDVRDHLSRASLDRVRGRGVRVVVVDDASGRRLAAHLAFYPPVPQVEELDWSEFRGERYAGWEWVLLGSEFASPAFVSPELSDSSPAIDILVAMGGSDPAGMSEFTIAALGLLQMPFAVRLVVGPAFSFARAVPLIDAIVRSHHSVRVARGLTSLAHVMRSSRMAVAAFGVTAYELAACGVPAIHLCLTPDHARSSSAFARAGAAVPLGVFGAVSPQQLADAVGRMMAAAGRRGEMARRASQLVDGRGAERVAALVAAGLS